MKPTIKYIATLMLIVILTACESQWDSHIEPTELRAKSLMQQLKDNPRTTTFATVVQKAGYDQLLSGDVVLTVFAPVNEALSAIDMNDTELLKTIVRNHLAYAIYSVRDGAFEATSVPMINTKHAVTGTWKIGGVSIVNQAGGYNLTLRNGVMHLLEGAIPVNQNIWEYLKAIQGNLQVDFIKQQDRMIMDMEKSIQIGVDAKSGKPLYDTVWINTNPFLKSYPLHDESENFAFVLVPNSVISRVETKYARYFAKENAAKQDSIVRSEFLKDCILMPVEISADGRYSSVNGVLMDLKMSDFQQVYNASNGKIYVFADADVKIYENKVKTLIIEGEDFHSTWSNNANSWMLRYRPTLSGGMDMVLNSPTTYITQYRYSNPDTTINVSINRTFYPMGSSNIGNVNNIYIEFRPIINSVAYKLYWSAYNDYSSNINLPVSLSINTGSGTVAVDTVITNHFSQKLLMSFPDRPRVTRNPSNGNIQNNFSPDAVFTSTRIKAGVQEEKQLFRAVVNPDPVLYPFAMLTRNTTSTGEDDFFQFFTGSDALGNKETIINPVYGQATIFVANTTETRAANSGMIFVDYIRLVPVVDPNE